MKKVIYIFAYFLSLAACMDIGKVNPYEADLHLMCLSVSFPEDFGGGPAKGVFMKVQNSIDGSSFDVTTDSDGNAVIELPNGLYTVTMSHSADDQLFSAAGDRIVISGADKKISFVLQKVLTGDILIKEIYCGGCKKLPQEGEYQSDKYIIIHNNTGKVQFVDNICLGMLSPANSTANNPWISKDSGTGATVFPEFLPLFEAVWQIGGDGDDFPLAPGEDAVIVICGAIDHTLQYPLSVNLNHEDYFVCYNTSYFPNTLYHPAPGDRIRPERILNVVVKTGKSNAFPFSVSSPAPVLFRPEGITMQEYVLQTGSIIYTPGSDSRVACIPYGWVLDAVEVFDGRSTNNTKRLTPQLDGGYVYQSTPFHGYSLMRRKNETKSVSEGYEVLVDTNNSSNDFFERESQSLHTNMEGDGYE